MQLFTKFRELARTKVFVSQSDGYLAGRGLLVSGGGLCGPTCIANVGQLVGEVIGVGHQTFPEREVHRVTDEITRRSGKDTRYGAREDHFAETLLSSLPGTKDYSAKVDIKTTNVGLHQSASVGIESTKKIDLNDALIGHAQSTVKVIVISSVDKVTRKTEFRHYMVVTGDNVGVPFAGPQTKPVIRIQDPNDPKDEFVGSIEETKWGENTVPKLTFHYLKPDHYLSSDKYDVYIDGVVTVTNGRPRE